MSHADLYEKMAQCVITGEADVATALAKQSLELGIPPLESIDNGFVKGIRVVGDRFGAGELFLPELVMSAEAMKAALAVLEPELAKGNAVREVQGNVLACTVQGDIHDIGKRIVCTMLSANGFQVVDLGVNVKIDRFVEEIKTRKPDIVAMSALLTTTAPNQGKVIKLLSKEGIRGDYIVMVGGAPTSASWAKEIGADGYGENATEAVRVAKELMARKRARPSTAAETAAPVVAMGDAQRLGAASGGTAQVVAD
ncbi:MAG TPA: corrinoid protein [Candidatus Polarisedimenticolia bacterium]|nr:corrinoid protein [Candidatus Polarisedimenticolia bacterium]